MNKFVNVIVFVILASIVYSSCTPSGHKQQSWKPKTGKKMKAGKNNGK